MTRVIAFKERVAGGKAPVKEVCREYEPVVV